MINISFFTWLKNLIFHLMICAKPIIMDLLIADFLFLPCYICCMTGIAKSVKPVIDHFNKFNSIQSAHCLATRAGRPCLASDRGRSWIIVWMPNKTLTSKQLYSRFVSGIRNNQRNSYEIKFWGRKPLLWPFTWPLRQEWAKGLFINDIIIFRYPDHPSPTSDDVFYEQPPAAGCIGFE